jgi:hypothetical protein
MPTRPDPLPYPPHQGVKRSLIRSVANELVTFTASISKDRS